MSRVKGSAAIVLRASLAAAACFAISNVAQAADLPIKAKAVEYVRVCSLYGAGFYYIPGTDTCIKLGGYLRVDGLAFNGGVATQQSTGVNAANNRLTNYYQTRSREDFNVDTRTATEYGVVRTFADVVFTWTSNTYNGASATLASPGTTAYATGADAIAGGSLGVYYAFIQFAGFTMGKAVSQFDAPWNNYPGNNFDGLVGGSGTSTGVNQFAYTADFGQGITFSVSAEEQAAYYQTAIWNTSGASAAGVFGGAYGVGNYGGQVSPDFIGKLRIDQAWGLFQASVAAHDNHVGYYGATEATGHPDDKWGWAGQLALSIKNIPTGPGDVINVQGVYTHGASRYNFQSLGPIGYSLLDSGGVGFAGVSDAVYSGTSAATGTTLELTSTWGFRGAFTHNWNPYWNTAIYGAYAGVRYDGAAKTLICTSAGMVALLPAGSTCNPDFNIAQLGTITRWTPVKNLTFSADVMYTHLDQKFTGTATLPAGITTTALPAGVYALKDQDTVSLLLRAQRNW